MTTINVNQILQAIGGPKGLPFPIKAGSDDEYTPSVIASGFKPLEPVTPYRNRVGTPLWSTNNLGAMVFMPVFLNGFEVPNALIGISGEKETVEEDMIGVGTCIETIFRKPYDITIIATVFGSNGEWPEADVNQLIDGWELDQVLTLTCAGADRYLNAKDNFVLTRITQPEMEGIENCQVIQFEGRSNIEFELEII